MEFTVDTKNEELAFLEHALESEIAYVALEKEAIIGEAMALYEADESAAGEAKDSYFTKIKAFFQKMVAKFGEMIMKVMRDLQARATNAEKFLKGLDETKLNKEAKVKVRMWKSAAAMAGVEKALEFARKAAGITEGDLSVQQVIEKMGLTGNGKDLRSKVSSAFLAGDGYNEVNAAQYVNSAKAVVSKQKANIASAKFAFGLYKKQASSGIARANAAIKAGGADKKKIKGEIRTITSVLAVISQLQVVTVGLTTASYNDALAVLRAAHSTPKKEKEAKVEDMEFDELDELMEEMGLDL